VSICVGNGVIDAHAAVLVASSPLFERVLLSALKGVSMASFPAPVVAVECVNNNCDGRAITVVRLGGFSGSTLTVRGVLNVVEWLYTGDCHALPGRDLSGAVAARAPGETRHVAAVCTQTSTRRHWLLFDNFLHTLTLVARTFHTQFTHRPRSPRSTRIAVRFLGSNDDDRVLRETTDAARAFGCLELET
jgi:hypothetical protein